MKGDELTICMHYDRLSVRPTEFTSVAGDKRSLQVLGRVSDKEVIQGTWKFLSVTANGTKLEKEDFSDRSMTFSGDGFTGPIQKRTRPGKFVLDTKANPKQIDLHIPGERNVDVVFKGIYRFEGEKLAICVHYDRPSKRPTKFTSVAGVSVAYLQEGSFVRFLIEQHGMAKFLTVYGGKSSYAMAYGKSFQELEVDWVRFIEGQANPKKSSP